MAVMNFVTSQVCFVQLGLCSLTNKSIKKGENLIHMYLSSHDNEAIGY